jgi:hypothetical protein
MDDGAAHVQLPHDIKIARIADAKMNHVNPRARRVFAFSNFRENIFAQTLDGMVA